MADEDKIRYSDIIQPDDSIERLIKQLEEFNSLYGTTINAIRAGADRIVYALKTASGATKDGRKNIDDATAAASRLERAYKELQFSMSDTGKMVAMLKTETRDNNKISAEQARYLKQASTSYDRLKSDLQDTVRLYKSLTAAERADSQMGKVLLQDIINLKNQISAIDKQLKPHIQTLSEVEKAEQRLSFLQSEEGKRLIELKARISELTNARNQQKATVDPLAKKEQELAYAKSEENRQLKLYTTLIREANQVAKLEATIANSAEGSYKRLSAQYELNKIKLNQMSGAQREATNEGKKLEQETNAIYKQMIKLQEATGNYRLSVGNYARAWDGLGNSVSQIVRELPAAAISLNTLFLGLSNNIPILVDEIARLRAENKAAIAKGEQAKSVVGSVVKALLSWNTVIVIALTLLSMFGDEIGTWVRNLFKGERQALSTADAIRNINEELENSNADYGSSVVAFKKLTNEYRALKTEAEKTEWIENNTDGFEDLGLAIDSVTDAENAFVNNTEAVLGAFKLRTKAAAAQKLAEEKYAEAFAKEQQALATTPENATTGERITAYLGAASLRQQTPGNVLAENLEAKAENLQAEAEALKKEADTYYDLYAQFTDAEQAILNSLGINGDGAGSADRQRDLTDTIYRISLSAKKDYEESVTKLERDEYDRRKKQAEDAASAEIRQMKETLRKLGDYLADEENKYKDLTEEEKRLVAEAQENIRRTIVNIREQLNYDLEQLDKEARISELSNLQEAIRLRLAAVKEGSEEELRLRLQALEVERQIALAKNAKLPASEQQDEGAINASYDKQSGAILADYLLGELEQQQELERARFNIVERSEKETAKFQLEQEREMWQARVDLARAGMLDWSKEQIATAEATIEGINRQLSDLDSFIKGVGEKGFGYTILESLGFDDDSINGITDAVGIVVDQLQEIADAEVQLAEAAVEAAQTRVDAAQEAYEAEVEARNNGYANNVATAKKELEQEKKNLLEKQKMQEEAQKRQQALDTITQTSSLITASANLWSAFSSIKIVGPALALAAIATMWASFAAAKVKARQATSAEYGEGGLEFLEGGSHASGNDIDLGVSNKKKRRMRAEGGEALAIINKRRTRKYRKILPDIVRSLNKGTFEDKYINAFRASENVNISLNSGAVIDISSIEKDVRSIKKQNETKYFITPNGTTVIQYKNVKRVIKK